jgi:hypothetical protein
MANSTITIQSVVDFARLNVKLAPLVGVGGITNEPALSIANDTIQEVLAPPYNWKWNRNEMGLLVTQQFKQDYLTAGATAFVLQNANATALNCGGVGIDLVSNNGITSATGTSTVKTLETHPFQVGQTVYITGTGSAYDSSYSLSLAGVFTGGNTITAVPNSTSFQIATPAGASGTSGAPGITNFGWLESATIKQVNSTSTPQPIFIGQAVRMIDPSSDVGDPERFAVIKDNGNGILKVRCWPVPSTYSWGVNIVYQGKAALVTNLSSTWNPIPDELSYVFRQGFIAKAFRFVDSVRADREYAIFLQNIMRALGQSDAELDTQGFSPNQPLFR